jgi:hypothetical protein
MILTLQIPAHLPDARNRLAGAGAVLVTATQDGDRWGVCSMYLCSWMPSRQADVLDTLSTLCRQGLKIVDGEQVLATGDEVALAEVADEPARTLDWSRRANAPALASERRAG